MTTERHPSIYLAVLTIFICLALFAGPRLSAQSVSTDPLFEFGDGADPVAPGLADILGDIQPGPDWDNLFGAGAGWRDDFDEFGNAGSNGVPDFMDTYGTYRLRRDAAFIADDVSAGIGTDTSALIGAGQVGSAVVASTHDIGNAYLYSGFNADKDFIVYAGLERLQGGDSYVEFELNRGVFSVDGAGQIVGDRRAGDIKVFADFGAGILSAVDISVWSLIDAELGIYDWVLLENLPVSPEQGAEQCNAAGTICAVCNGVTVDGGAWDSYDGTGQIVTGLVADTFLEIGVNVGALLGIHDYVNYYDTRYTSIQLSTPADYALGGFARAWKLAQAQGQ